eukprot:3236840-Amphidinium_carterae.1
MQEQSVTQIDYVFIRGDNEQCRPTVLTMCVTTTGVGHATVVQRTGLSLSQEQITMPYKRSRLKRFIVESGLQITIIQSDSEPSIIELFHDVTLR